MNGCIAFGIKERIVNGSYYHSDATDKNNRTGLWIIFSVVCNEGSSLHNSKGEMLGIKIMFYSFIIFTCMMIYIYFREKKKRRMSGKFELALSFTI